MRQAESRVGPSPPLSAAGWSWTHMSTPSGPRPDSRDSLAGLVHNGSVSCMPESIDARSCHEARRQTLVSRPIIEFRSVKLIDLLWIATPRQRYYDALTLALGPAEPEGVAMVTLVSHTASADVL